MSTDDEPKFPFKVLLPVLLTVLLDLLGFGLVIPLLSYYAEDYGAGAIEVTLLMACYSVAQFVFAPLWGSLSDRVGRRPVMLFSIAGTASMLAGFAAAPSLLWLFIFRTLHGAMAANISTAQAYVADVTTPSQRAMGMGLIGASFGVGMSLGPWVGGELSPWGLSTPIWVAAGLSAINLVWAFFALPESRPSGGERKGSVRTVDPRRMLEGLGHPVVGMAIGLAFVATFAFSMMESTFALVAEHVWGMDARAVGRFFGLIGIVGIVIQGGMIGRLVKRFGEAKLVGAGYLLNALGLGTLAFTTGGAGIYIGCTLLAMGISMANPSLFAMISKGVGPHEQGRVLGINQSFSAMARATAPTIGGLLFAHWFMGGAFLFGGLLMLLALGISVPALAKIRPPTAPESAPSSP